MSELALSTILSRFNDIEVETIEPSRPQVQNDDERFYKKFRRHGLFGYIKQKLKISSNPLKTQESDLLVQQHFTWTLNPLYEKTAQLPKKIFVCGYCKEPFFTPAQYIKHCYIEDCHLNHQRSTYFFTFKNEQRKIQNEDLRKKLSKKQLLTLLKTDYGKEFTLLSCQKSLIGNGTKNYQPSTDKCSICKQRIPSYVNYFKSHSLLQCSGRNVPQPKKLFRFLFFDQPLKRFVQEIINFHLNYNLLSSFENFYYKMIPNNRAQQIKKFYCSHCKVSFQDENTFLQHLIFECTSNAKESSPKLRIQPTPEYTISKFVAFPDFTSFKKIYANHRKQTVNQWQEVVNQRYGHLKQILTNVYFCGQCLNIFQTSRLYIAHCIRFNCTINHPKTSHKFLSCHGKKTLKLENFSFQSIENQFKRIFFDYQLLRKMNFTLNVKKGLPTKRGNYRIFNCGKCQKQFYVKEKFTQHLFMVCLSQNHPKTNYSIKIQCQKLNEEDYEKIIMNHFYAMKIAQCSFGYKYVLSKNDKVDFEGNYMCGSCENFFESKQEYVYHSITVCQSLKSHESSHFIQKIYNPATSIYDPLLNLFETSKKDSLKVVKNVNYQIRTHDKNPPRMRRNAEQQIQLEKIEETYQQVQTSMDQLIEQKRQEQNFPEQKVQKLVENKLQAQTSQSVLVRDSVRRFLRFNIDGSLPHNTKFYCGKCKQSFKTDRKFIEHLEQTCHAFQHKQSSHFYVSNKRMHEIHEKMGLFNSFDKKTLLPREFSIYLPKKTDKFLCVCGQTDFVSKIINHRKYHFDLDHLKPQHFAYLDLRVMNARKNIIQTLFLPSFVKNSKPTHEFVCPCKPWKRLTYEEFTKHLIKRHGGRTPKFLMKMPENKNEQIQI